MKPALLTFDLDETLWEVAEPIRRANAAQWEWLGEHRPDVMHLQTPEAQKPIQKKVWATHSQDQHNISLMRIRFLEALLLEAGYGAADSAGAARQAFDVFLKQRQRVQLYPGVLEVLRELASRYRLAALTNGNADIFKSEAAEHFEFAFRAEEVGAKKPDPALFLAAMKQSGVAAERIVHIGDHPFDDVHGAREAGLRAIWVNRSADPWDGNGPAPDTIQDLTELPGLLASGALWRTSRE